MGFPIKFQCKLSDKEEVPMYWEVRPEGKNRYLPMGRRIPTKFLTDKGKAIDSSVRGAKRYADFVTKEKLRLEDLWEQLRNEGYSITFELLKEYYTSAKEVKPIDEELTEQRTKQTSFAEFARNTIHNEVLENAIDSDVGIRPETAALYHTEIERLEAFHSGITLEQITPDFVKTYYEHCQREGGFSRNHPGVRIPMTSGSMQRVEKFLRKYLSRAEDAKYIAKSPMKEVRKLRVRFGVREYLNVEEIKQLSELYFSGDLLKEKNASGKVSSHGRLLQTTLWYMLAGCYMGMRYSDWREFDPNEHIREGRLIKWIVKGGKKKQVIIPIRKPMQDLLDDVWKPGERWTHKVPHNSTYNARIMRITLKVSIHKKITSHCLRHTFAITSLLLGMRIETISDLLGHSDLVTTQIYARIVNEIRESQMDVWNDFFKERDDRVRVFCERCATKLLEYEASIIRTPMLELACSECGVVNQHRTSGSPTTLSSLPSHTSEAA